jgi:hypothetical protein
MSIGRGKLSRLLAPGLAAIYFNWLKLRKPEYDAWINVKTSKKAYEEYYKMAGLGRYVKKGEGQVYSFDEPLPGDVIRYTHQTFGLGFRVTEEMWEDDQYGIMNRLSKELAKSAAHNKEVQAHSVLNNGWNTAYKGFDGKPLFATDHPLLDGSGVLANTPTTQADLSPESLQAAVEYFETIVDDRGLPAQVTPKKLIVGPQNMFTAYEILDTQQVPYGNDNTVNVLATRYGITPHISHYLTDSDSWFLAADKSEHDLNIFIRVNDEYNAADDPLTGDSINTGRHRLSTGFGDFRGVYGSQGA